MILIHFYLNNIYINEPPRSIANDSNGITINGAPFKDVLKFDFDFFTYPNSLTVNRY